MTKIYPPVFDPIHFDAAVDRTSEWLMANVPWQRLEITRLYTRSEFTPGSSWGRNLWGEYYRGETVNRRYVAIPERLVAEVNLELIYRDSVMRILRDAQPAYTRPRSWSNPELIGYYLWMGVPR